MTAAGAAGTGEPLKVFIVAGEQSGEQLGAQLIEALRDRRPAFVFEGVGGDAMARAGVTSVFPMTDISVMGYAPIIPRLPRLIKRLRQTIEAAVAARPDVLVIIDSSGFTHRVAQHVRRRLPAVPIVDYVSPTVWAWRSGRAAAMRAYVDHVLALLPFEPEAHRRLGGPPCTYVGHPLIERLTVLRPNDEERAARDRPTLLVLPGSRRSEIARLARVFGETVERVANTLEPLEVLVPAAHGREAEVRAEVARWPVGARVLVGEAEKYAAFRRARAALVASGTATLELALSGVPMVVGYKVSPLEIWLKYLVKVPSIVLPNLILGQNAVPEFIQDACEPGALARALAPLLEGGDGRDAQTDALARLDDLMLLGPGGRPSQRAADVVLAVADARRASTPRS